MRPSFYALAEAVVKATTGASRLRSKKSPIEITDAAANRIKDLLEQRKKVVMSTPICMALTHLSPLVPSHMQSYLKLGVKTRGCSGMSYTLNYADEKGKFDEIVEEKGVRILIEPNALMHVLGTRMNYTEDDLKAEFTFDNPQAKGTCGCGESFTT